MHKTVLQGKGATPSHSMKTSPLTVLLEYLGGAVTRSVVAQSVTISVVTYLVT